MHRILFAGILGALILRGIFIVAGLALIEMFTWSLYLFGGFLLFTGLRLLFVREPAEGEEADQDNRTPSRFLAAVLTLLPRSALFGPVRRVGLTLAACAGRIPPGERPHLAIVNTVEVAAGSDPSSHVRDCDLADELLDELEDEAERHFQLRRVSDHRGVPGRVLVLRFAQAEGAWGGAISGSKKCHRDRRPPRGR